MKQKLGSKEFIMGIKSADISVLSQAITLIESKKPQDISLSISILDCLMSKPGKSIRLGITGAPGVGKSTFISQFGKLIHAKGQKLAVLAVDPSSSRSHGSIMGDKTRMTELLQLPNVFVRPTPAGDNLGGVARKTREAMLLCEAAGYDYLIIETVGTGQSETTVQNMVDFLLLLLPPLGGDELQGIKKGVVELADGIAITKSDGDNIKAASAAAREYKSALQILSSSRNQSIDVQTCSALENIGLEEIYEGINSSIDNQQKTGKFLKNREDQLISWMHEELKHQLTNSFYTDKNKLRAITDIEQMIRNNKISPHSAVQKLLAGTSNNPTGVSEEI